MLKTFLFIDILSFFYFISRLLSITNISSIHLLFLYLFLLLFLLHGRLLVLGSGIPEHIHVGGWLLAPIGIRFYF